MKLALVSPPTTTPFAPSMALLALRSYLQSKGVTVVPIDGNIDAIHYALEPTRCRQYIEPILPALAKGLPEKILRGLAPKRVVDPGNPEPPLDHARAISVLAQLETIRTAEGFTFTREHFTSELAVVNDALILASLRMFPHPLTVWGLTPEMSPRYRPEHNPYLGYCRDELIPSLQAMAPDVIAISLGHTDQLSYSMFLINGLRRIGVDVPIVIGGACFSCFPRPAAIDDRTGVGYLDASGRLSPDYTFTVALLGGFDPFAARPTMAAGGLTIGVLQEGERPLLEICECLARGESPLEVPGVISLDPDNRELVFNKPGPPIDGKDLPKIDLTGLGIGAKYLTPIPMATLVSSRGCYWDKCTFCDHAQTLGPGFRELSVDVVAETLESYSKDFGVGLVFFCDESFSPSMLKALTAKMVEKDVFMNFGTMCRIEKAFIPLIAPAAERGLRFLSFGWESGCDRIVSEMNKGYRREDERALLDECFANNVRVQYFVMFGFPTETPTEADQTLAYLSGLHDKLWNLSVAPWTLTPGSHIRSHLGEFAVAPAPGRSASTNPDSYQNVEGLDRQQALDYITRLKTHPDLKKFFQIQGVEDYGFIIDVLADDARQ